MKYLLISIMIAVAAFNAASQQSTVPVTPVKKVLTLKMARTIDDKMPGTRGASVAWHPVYKKYYAAMAGNASYPLSIFDATGKRLSPDSTNCEVDARGLWYNPDKKSIQGNTFDDAGWFRYDHTATGMIREMQYLTDVMTQPNAQCVGAFNYQNKDVLFLNGDEIWFYDVEEAVKGAVLKIHWGRTRSDGPDTAASSGLTPESYNYTTVIYTGMRGSELGFLKPNSQEIELYNIKTGFLTQSIKLPSDAAIYEAFNFAYCNGIYWIFNIETREWSGYK
jgi:hypothetical protein